MPQPMPQEYVSLIMMVVLFGILYFTMIRPQKKKDKEIQKMRSSLSVGDEVITIGGLHGKIAKVNDEVIVLEVSQGKQRLEFSKWAIGNVVKKGKVSKQEQKNNDKAEDNKTEDIISETGENIERKNDKK